MSISFADPLALGLLVPALGLILLLSAAARRHISRRRRALSVALRVVVVTLVVFALAGFSFAAPVDRLTTVFVVDLSDSIGAEGRDAAVEFVRGAVEEIPDGDRAGIVAFGSEALVERLPSETRELDALASAPVRTATDIGTALRLAAALFPDATQKRIVLVSDGNDTTGRGLSEASLAAARGIQVETYLVGPDPGSEEILVERLRTPTTARVGDEIEVEATIRSTVSQRATVRLFGDGVPLDSRQEDLEAGTNRVVFAVEAREAGFHTFRVVVEAGQDTFGQNNRADSNTTVQGDPRILVVAGNEDVAENLVAALEAENKEVSSVLPEALPGDLESLAAFDSVILVDAPATRLTGRQMGALQVFVRDLGRGLVMVGGSRSYGAGGYRQTPLEEALPVEMDVRNREKQPDVALVVVIDKSGSMDACHCNTANRDMGSAIEGVPKVDIGKEAIVRAVSALTERDEFGVVAFNENAGWVIRTAPLGTVGDVEGQIAGIRPEGNTNIFAGLSEAVASLEETSATRRHVILLTDGWSSSGDYPAVLRRMKAAGITLSTVGAGSGSAEVLEELAEQGGGRFYNATNPSSIPDIFLKETQQVSGQQIVEESFFPIQTSSSPILTGLEEGLPRLLGYNGTTAKAAAQTVLVTARDDPLLAQWQYGLGRSVAWTSDATGRWAKNWVAWDGFSRFFAQLVSWTLPGEDTAGVEAELVAEGDDARLIVRSFETDGTPRNFYETVVTLVRPDLTTTPVTLTQTAPGTYEAQLGRIDAGAYAARVIQTKSGATPLGRTVGLVAPTAAEYRLLGANEPLLTALRTATGGRALAVPADAWRHDLRATTGGIDLWPLLLLLALLLWPLDVAVRRVSVTGRDMAAVRARAAARWATWRGPAARAGAIDGMLAAKERAAGTRTRRALAGAAPSTDERKPPVAGPAVRRAASEAPVPPASPAPAAAAPGSESQAGDAPPRPAESSAAPGAAPGATQTTEAPDTMRRLRQAKGRARR
jgi:uncharacterized membrane protein